MSQPKTKTIEELAKLLSGAADRERKIAMTERCIADWIVDITDALGGRQPRNRIVYYDDQVFDYVTSFNHVLNNLVREYRELRSENIKLKNKISNIEFEHHAEEKVSWWRSFFKRK